MSSPGEQRRIENSLNQVPGERYAFEYWNGMTSYISDSFQARYEELKAKLETEYTDPEDRDEYLAANIFWVPSEARWESVQAQAPQPQSLANQVLRKIGGACGLYNRLILVVGSAGNGKTGALQEVQTA
jgi:hypothetical protein